MNGREGWARLAGPAAWSALGLTLVLGLVSAVLGLQRGSTPAGVAPFGIQDLQYPLNAVAFAGVGALVASRHPRNVIWVVLSTYGLVSNFFGFGTEYTILATLREPGVFPGGALMTWVTTWIFQAIPTLLAVTFVIFPTGKAVSRRWSLLLWLVPVYVLMGWVPPMFLPGWTQNSVGGDVGPIHNPLAIRAAAPVLAQVAAASNVVLVALLVGAIASLIVRYRRGGAEERHQLKYVIFAGVFLPIGFLVYPLYAGSNVLTPVGIVALLASMVGVLGLPLAIGIAILKYRLYDIDIVISRTLVYGALALFITAIYVGIVVGIGRLVGGGDRPNLPLSIVATAVVAVAFQPVRERIQKIANRLVYGKRASPYEVLSQFSEDVAGSYSADEVLPRMARVLAEGTGAVQAGVWLRSDGWLREAARWPAEGRPADKFASPDDLIPQLPGFERVVAVLHREELLGLLAVAKRRGEGLTPVEEKLLADLASQAGLVLRNVGLASQLRGRLEELRDSRQRLVAAQDEERRRLERNLHDGAQQYLVAIKVKLGLAQVLLDRDPGRARGALRELKGDADEALETLRDLARGIYPALLAQMGLVAALQAHAGKATLPVEVTAPDLPRYPREVEAAVYFCCLEALQNVQKYAAADRVRVELSATPTRLDFRVSDDGRGFDASLVNRGAGLTNMADRIDALGGRFEVISAPGDGTVAAGSIPLPAAA